MAGAVVLLVLATAVAGLFCLHLSNKRCTGALDFSEGAANMMESTRLAQINFKIQVQEWKNTLLRGHTPEGMTTYFGAFEKRETMVRTFVEEILKYVAVWKVAPESEARLKEILKLHAELGAAYRTALQKFKADDPLSIRAVDAEVRGKDRQIDEALDSFAVYVRGELSHKSGVAKVENEALYKQLRTVVFVISGITFVVTLVFAWKALKINGQPSARRTAGGASAPMETRNDSRPGSVS
ncbi:hypothetical protein DB346_19895 [Verrucomicrobia bacterium LW23]|nr:hypothetical protein DB346_19895 [Verrucomicrobia bacterium LW23]